MGLEEAVRTAGSRRARCEEAMCGSAEGVAHIASSFKRQRCAETNWYSWNRQQERILHALTPPTCSFKTTQLNQGAEQEIQCTDSSIEKPDETDKFSLNIDDPRMRYAEVAGLVDLFNFDALAKDQPEAENDSNDEDLTSLLKYTHVAGGL
jgi:hypothetical protein